MLKGIAAVRRLRTSYTNTGKKHLTFCDAYHWKGGGDGDALAFPQDNFFSLLGGRQFFLGGKCPPILPLLRTLLLGYKKLHINVLSFSFFRCFAKRQKLFFLFFEIWLFPASEAIKKTISFDRAKNVTK